MECYTYRGVLYHAPDCWTQHPAGIAGVGAMMVANVNPQAAGGCPRRAAQGKVATEKARRRAEMLGATPQERAWNRLAFERAGWKVPTMLVKRRTFDGKAAWVREQQQTREGWSAAPRKAYNVAKAVRYDAYGEVKGKIKARRAPGETVLVLA